MLVFGGVVVVLQVIGFGWFWWLGLCFMRLQMSLAGCNSPDAKYTSLHEFTYHLISLTLTTM